MKEVIINSLVAFALTIIIGFVMMVTSNSLTRAFALVGALSIIRFRTVVKDTAYVFWVLAVGMGAGTGNYFIALYATLFMSLVAWVMYKFNFGVQRSSDNKQLYDL